MEERFAAMEVGIDVSGAIHTVVVKIAAAAMTMIVIVLDPPGFPDGRVGLFPGTLILRCVVVMISSSDDILLLSLSNTHPIAGSPILSSQRTRSSHIGGVD